MTSGKMWRSGWVSRLSGGRLLDKGPILGRLVQGGLEHPELLETRDPAEPLRRRVDRRRGEKPSGLNATDRIPPMSQVNARASCHVAVSYSPTVRSLLAAAR